MHLHQSQSADALANALARVISTPLRSPFEPELVVVSGRASERALKLRIAQQLGICSNVRFLSPSTLLEETLAATLGESRGLDGAWSASDLAWTILRILPAQLADPRFAAVRNYLGDSDTGSARYVTLARHLGECFERYVLSRPEMVVQWESGDDTGGDQWQPVLWRAVRDAIAVPHLAQLWHDVRETLERGSIPADALPQRLTWLAHPGVARLHLDVFAAIARAGVDAHLFLLMPSRVGAAQAWDDSLLHLNEPLPPSRKHSASGNAWLESMGRQSRDAVFGNARAVRGVCANHDHWIAPSGETMLAQLQCDVIDSVRRGTGAQPSVEIRDVDDSVRIHACHTAMRQVEVLRDELLRLLNDDPTLAPRDILVLTPAIRDFAPLIDAVFGHDGRKRTGAGTDALIPFHLLDRPMRTGNVLAEALLCLLDLPNRRTAAASVLDILALPPIAARFALEASDRETLVGWVRESGIRWATDEDDRAHHAVPAERANTWRFGLDRLIIGWGIPLDNEALFEGVLPWDEIEGSDAELLGRFTEACEWIFEWIHNFDEARPVGEWCAILRTLVRELAGDDSQAWPAQEVLGVLEELQAGAERGQLDRVLDLSAMRLLLDAELDDEHRVNTGSGGGVSFGMLAPGRTFPARVVCVLGADEAVFPRQRTALGFDLIARDPQAGDTDASSDDRQRFLEAFMSAGERFIVTYTGRSVRANVEIPAAVPVAELLDLLNATFRAVGPLTAAGTPTSGKGSGTSEDEAHSVGRRVCIEHPLQVFSPRNFTSGGTGTHPIAHDSTFLAAAKGLVLDRSKMQRRPFMTGEVPTSDDASIQIVRLEDLVRWIADPAGYFLKNQLLIAVGEDAEILQEREPVSLDHLRQSNLRTPLIKQALKAKEMGNETARGPRYDVTRASGSLPHGEVGRQVFEGVSGEADTIVRSFEALRENQTSRSLTIDLPVGNVRLTGRAGEIYGARQLLWRAGTIVDKHVAEVWVRHLAACAAITAAGEMLELTTTQVGKGKGVVTPSITFTWVNEATAHLTRLIDLYRMAQRAPLPFFPASSRALAKAAASQGVRTIDTVDTWAADQLDEAMRDSQLVFAPPADSWSEFCDASNPAVVRLFGDWNPGDDPEIDRAFVRAAISVWGGALEHLEEKGL